MACTAPSPSKTAPKQSAAKMTHMNMQLTLNDLCRVSSNTLRVNRPLNKAASVAAPAPTAELSTRLVTPIMNRPVIEKIMTKGKMPARSRLNFSLQLIPRRSSTGSAGPK